MRDTSKSSSGVKSTRPLPAAAPPLRKSMEGCVKWVNSSACQSLNCGAVLDVTHCFAETIPWTLTPFIQVRILVPQPHDEARGNAGFFLGVASPHLYAGRSILNGGAEAALRFPSYRARRCTIARMPCRIALGLGGQPAIVTSTGMTLAMRPRLA